MKENRSLLMMFSLCLLLVSVVGTIFSYFLTKQNKMVVLKTQQSYNISYVIDTPVYLDHHFNDSLNAFYEKNLSYDVFVHLEKMEDTKVFLSIYDTNQMEVKNLEGFIYTKDGFDVSGYDGEILVAKNYLYAEEQNWRFVLTIDNDTVYFKQPRVFFQ